MQWFGKPTPQNRFLGQVDQDDPTNLPNGLAAVCRNKDFTRDSGGPTCATTRAGNNTAMQCIDPNAPVTGAIGFVYAPETDTDPLIVPEGSFVARCQRPLAFQPTQGSQYEYPLGTGRMVKFPQTNFTEPQQQAAIPPNIIPPTFVTLVNGSDATSIGEINLNLSEFTPVLVGDLAVIFIWTAGVVTIPAGWTLLAQSAGNTFNGTVISKVLGPADLGALVILLAGDDGRSQAAAQVTRNANGIRNVQFTQSAASPESLTTATSIQVSDLGMQFAACLSTTPATNPDVECDTGFQVSSVSGNAIGTTLNTETIAAAGAYTANFTSTEGPFDGFFSCIVVVANALTPGRPAGGLVHKIDASAGNQVFGAYSDLQQAVGGSSTLDPKALTLNPFGMKPFGWHWLPQTNILAMEVATPGAPVTGNGHTYQAQNSGATGPVEPVWPLVEGGEVTEVLSDAQVAQGLVPVTWKEKTMVIANRLPVPDAPALTLGAPASGTLPNNFDIYVVMTLLNSAGESLGSIPAIITTNAANQSVNIQVPALADLAGWIQTLSPTFVPTQANIYMAALIHNVPPPALSTYLQYLGTVALGTLVNMTAFGTGGPPPTINTARVTPGQLPTPTLQPVIDRDPGAGGFPAGRDVYVLLTYTNALGETPAGPANSVINTTANDAVQVTVAVPLGPNNVQLYTIGSVGIYVADVATGDPAPPSSAFSLFGYFQPGDTPLITATVSGQNPPLLNTTGPGGSIVADTATGGANGTQGYRYAAMGWINQIETFSGFTAASVVKTIIDLDGYEIGAFNVLTGMPNVVGRYIAFSIADASQSGPFDWIGLVNLQVPSQNVVYPTKTTINGVDQSATVFLDNVTTQGTFNFTDTYLDAGNNVDDRLDIVAPPQGVRVDYLQSIDRLVVTGAAGLTSGGWISLAEDYESFFGDNSPVPIRTSGERCFGWTDAYKGIPIALMEESGFVVSPNTGDPSSWNASKRWAGMGPCGFRAWDANGKMIVFAHRSGFYKYDESDPDMMQKEVPKKWSSINWAACASIDVTIDEDTHTIRIQAPTGASTINNEEFCLSYIEGWQNPIHFSTFASKEISMDAARRWSFNDFAAYICVRMKRTLPPNGNTYIDGPNWNTLPDSSFALTQLIYASSGPDGTLQARTPGIFSDNGTGIKDEYETMSTGLMQSLCKPEGFNLNATGSGNLLPSFIASRAEQSDEGGVNKLVMVTDEIIMDPIALTPRQIAGITRKCGGGLNEFWRIRMVTDWQPGSWCSLKAMTVYVIPFTGGRDPGDN